MPRTIVLYVIPARSRHDSATGVVALSSSCKRRGDVQRRTDAAVFLFQNMRQCSRVTVPSVNPQHITYR